MAEGLGCIGSGLLGALPVTSYTQNIGILAATGVASRRVVRVAAVMFLLYGLSPKLAQMLACIPRPVVGAVFLISASMIMFSGIDVVVSEARDARNNPDRRDHHRHSGDAACVFLHHRRGVGQFLPSVCQDVCQQQRVYRCCLRRRTQHPAAHGSQGVRRGRRLQRVDLLLLSHINAKGPCHNGGGLSHFTMEVLSNRQKTSNGFHIRPVY